ncbi:hypothetical protein IFM89_033145 [Coptis chinensis]|uniref:Uncharacterized protein n=1 Tax=Coptis chinensis TaxID=261450 RepID=A0A835HIH1_9MAGN|nr:hypothetical protein IFM89_033145 [Coptis chinensis]
MSIFTPVNVLRDVKQHLPVVIVQDLSEVVPMGLLDGTSWDPHFMRRNFRESEAQALAILNSLLQGLGGHIWAILPYTIVWSIWCVRNEIIFRNGTFCINKVINKIKEVFEHGFA